MNAVSAFPALTLPANVASLPRPYAFAVAAAAVAPTVNVPLCVMADHLAMQALPQLLTDVTVPALHRPLADVTAAALLARIWTIAPAWSLRWNFSAPQQPAAGASRVCTPAASSTRAVAKLMLGIIAGCTQPASSSIFRACKRCGHTPAD